MRPTPPDPPATDLNRRKTLMLVAAATALAARPGVSAAATAQELARDSRLALDRLYATRPQARDWSRRAKAILVFPEIVKAGFMVGAQGGEGALLMNDQVVGFFRTTSGSFGLQAGAQKFSYALFLMNQKAVDHVKAADGWSVGSDPSLVVVDEGVAKSLTTNSMNKDIYAVVWGQKGLMGGLDVAGSKISRFHPKA